MKQFILFNIKTVIKLTSLLFSEQATKFFWTIKVKDRDKYLCTSNSTQATEVSTEDVKVCYKMFLDEKRSTEYLNEYEGYILGVNDNEGASGDMES